MASLTLGQKAERLLKLLLGLENRRALAALQQRGFQQTDLDEGWTLLKRVVNVRFNAVPVEAGPNVVGLVDAWENQWFPIVDATLRRAFPDLHAKVMLNLSQTDGPPVILSVSTLLQRLDALRAATDADSQAAIAKLAVRGVTPAVLDEVRAMLASVTTLGPAPAPASTPADDVAQRERNLEAMWAYYLEWSAIARSAIKDRGLLRSLGFGPPRKRPGEEEDDAAEDAVVAPVAPIVPIAPVVRPAPVVPTA